MGPEEFRKLALSLPGAEEREHMDHPDFRVGGKIFATLGYPDESFAMVRLAPELQAQFVKEDPDIFTPVKGAWGKQGATHVRLKAVKKPKRVKVHEALTAAWEVRAKVSKTRVDTKKMRGV
jgi:hypothetical protein